MPPREHGAAKRAAKFPPDDDAPAGGGGAPQAPGGAGAADDGNFKRGRFSPAAIGLAVLLAAGAGGALYMAKRTHVQRMTVEQRVKTKKDIFVLAKAEQVPQWRKWAAVADEPELQQEALVQLAYAEDPEGVKLAIAGLKHVQHTVRGTSAQVLAHYGLPAAEGAKAALLEALKTADESDRPQIVWALVALKEPQGFNAALDEYRKGHLSKVERLGGGTAFDAEALAGVVSLDELAKLADDQSPSVRQLIATVLSRNAEPKWTPTLTKLVKDADIEVAREAANGLGKIADDAARAPLLEALGKADKESRTKFIQALKDGIGGEGLVLALSTVSKDKPETTWFQTRQIFELLEQLADPRCGDALVKWVEETKPAMHWVGEAGLRLAEVGDVRGAKYIAQRMAVEPKDIYQMERFWEADKGGHLSRHDNHRAFGARMLADLAVIHGAAKGAELKGMAEDAVIKWIEPPRQHANGLRFLATVKSDKALKNMREWAFPNDPLPKEGAQPPMPRAYEVAQSALRYVGVYHDEESFTKLLDQFKRKKDKKMDITQGGLEGAGLAMLGMALRAVGVGAAEGLSEFGDARAIKPLIEFIEDEMWHEEARFAASSALAWVADDKTMSEVAKKLKEYAGKKEERKQLVAAMYAQTLTLRPNPAIVPELVDLLTTQIGMGTRISIARAIGVAGIKEADEAKLMEKLKDPELRNAAALAIVMGGTADAASRTIAMYADFGKEQLDDLKDHYYRAFGFWSSEDFKRGNLYRYVRNAIAITRTKVNDVPQEWAKQRLQSQFDNLTWDNGPHSETRVVLRYRLLQAAKSGDLEQKKNAIETLKFMREQGALMALRSEKGETGELAKKAFFEFMNPKLGQAEDLSKLQTKKKDEGGSVRLVP